MVLPESLVGESVCAVIGRYKLLERIGEGGCGVVYVAEQGNRSRRVALKVIKLGMDTKVVARFEAERQALALMDHPNIAKVWMPGPRKRAGLISSWNWSAASTSPSYCDQNNLSTRERLAPVHSGLPGHPARPPERHHPSGHQAFQHPGHAQRRRAGAQGD